MRPEASEVQVKMRRRVTATEKSRAQAPDNGSAFSAVGFALSRVAKLRSQVAIVMGPQEWQDYW